RAYNDGIEQYTTAEQVRASHILLKTEGKDDAAVKAKAEDVLKQSKAGADFSELAKKYSEDEASAKNGGDLDYFGRGRMVPEFDQAAFAMQESGFFARDEPILGLGPSPEASTRAFNMKQGEISGTVRTSRGFAFLTLVGKQDPYVPKIEEVKTRVRDEVIKQKAREMSRQ